MDKRDTYKEYGAYGVMLDYLYKMYFSYDFTYQTDEIATLLCNKLYVTPWTARSIYGRYNLDKKTGNQILHENLQSYYHKLRSSNYDTKEELYALIDPIREMSSKEIRQVLPKFFF